MDQLLPQIADFAQRVLATLIWTGVGVIIFYLGSRLYDMLDPIDYREEIKRGNIAAAVKFGAVMLGLAAIVVAAIVT
ncbi:MAG TPA: DUF350 domain-containing protein [Roseiflexaceae bacterium]|nr:DUF350 domain-containing protein [Roseiflexaceae bacterium]